MEYKLISGSPDQVAEQVNKLMADGFTAHGSPYFCNGSHYQAVVKVVGVNPLTAGPSGEPIADEPKKAKK